MASAVTIPAANEFLERYAEAIDKGGSPDHDPILWAMLRSSVAFMAANLLTGPPDPPYHGHFIVGEHHLAWDRIATHSKRFCILAPRDHSKCAIRGSMLLAANGRRTAIEDWQGGHLLAYDEDTHEIVPAYAPAARFNGVRQCVRVVTRTGREEIVTRNHPFRTLNQWVLARDLQPGQRIAVPRSLPNLGTKEVEDAWLMGLLVGDGGMTGAQVVLTTADCDVVREVKHVAARRQWRVMPCKNPQSMRLCCLRGLKNSRQKTPMRWAKSHGMNTHGRVKKVPEAILGADDATIAEFLAGYFDADGCASLLAGGSLSFSTVSPRLAADTQHLLTRLGIVSVKAAHTGIYACKPHTYYLTTIRGASILRFAARVRPRGVRRHKIAEIVRQQSLRNEGGSVDLLPREVCDRIGVSEDWLRKRGLPRFSRKYDMTRTKARRIAKATGNDWLHRLADAEIMWDQVVSVEEVGEQGTWAIHVPGYENYVGQDIINHNTYFFDFAYPIWQAMCFPKSIGLIFSGTSPQAIRILDDIKTEVETNPKLAHLYPGTKAAKWSATGIMLANGSRIYCGGFLTKKRGIHPNWIICDDVLGDDAMYSEMTRRKTKEFFFSSVSNMVIPGGTLGVVSTPFHSDDLYCNDLASNPKYTFAKYPAVNAKGRPLWPARYNRRTLRDKKIEIGSIRFEREFMCEPVTDEMSLFPKELFFTDRQMVRGATLGAPLSFWKGMGITSIVIGVDIAFSGAVGADYFVVWVQGNDQKHNRWIIDIRREKGLGFQQQKQLLLDVGTQYNPDVVYIESVQAQRILADELIQYTSLPVRHYHTGTERNTLTNGIPSLRILLENEKYRIPRGDARSIAMTDIWIEECNSFTFVDGRPQSVGGHDDTVLAAFIAEQASRAGGFGFDFGPGGQTGDNPGMPTAPAAQPKDPDMSAPSAFDMLGGGGF